MYFKRIEMHGFKSFAEPVVIDFHEGVTCIVGPNGSGKSNISDAIRWVLGEQSPKMLRGGKMEEVIFAGTASRKSRGMAEVTLVIDNSTGILDIDYNEVAITRRMYRSGESEYLINNNQCRLRDIKELIMDTGIGVDGYSIIGQGKIADIVSNKPESRREIFEEAAGVVMYKSKKAEAERKLEASNANLERVSDIVSEIEGRIDGLREDSAKAKEYLELRERYQDLEINITLKNIEKLETANDSIRGDARELTASIEKLGTRKQTLDGEISEERQKNERLEQLGNESNSALIAKIDELNQITNKSQLDGERLRAMERDAARINGEIAELESKLETEQENGETLSQNKKKYAYGLPMRSSGYKKRFRATMKLPRECSRNRSKWKNNATRCFLCTAARFRSEVKPQAWKAIEPPCKNERNNCLRKARSRNKARALLRQIRRRIWRSRRQPPRARSASPLRWNS